MGEAGEWAGGSLTGAWNAREPGRSGVLLEARDKQGCRHGGGEGLEEGRGGRTARVKGVEPHTPQAGHDI